MPRAAIPGSGSLVPLEYQESLGSGLHAEHGAMNEHAGPGCCDAVMMPFVLSDMSMSSAVISAGIYVLLRALWGNATYCCIANACP